MREETIHTLPEMFQGNLSTIKKTSYDKTNKVSMCESELSVVNFDKLPAEYSRGKGWPHQPKSNDALYIQSAQNWYFIEFKNGNVQKDDIYRKIYDSLILLQEEGIIKNLDFSRKNIEYILVYNSDKYPAGQQAPSRDAGYQYVARLANKEIVKFELDHLNQYLLRNTHTYTVEEFETKFVKVMEREESINTGKQ